MSVRSRLDSALQWIGRSIWIVLSILWLGGSSLHFHEPIEQVRRYTRPLEFDFFDWTLEAAGLKATQWSLGSSEYLSAADRIDLVLHFAELVRRASALENELANVYADPSIENPQEKAIRVSIELSNIRSEQSQLQPVFEAVLGEQISYVLAELGVGIGGRPFPPVAFHFSRLPDALIISPRDVIRQDANIQLDPRLTLEEIIALENQTARDLDVSSLVVPVGGVGTYPTMIMESSALAWVVEVIIHEWVHNYLTLRPLGWNYSKTPELRTMNETCASILGKEIGRLVLERYYPDLVPPDPVESPHDEEPAPPQFDFREEMRETRVNVDALLEDGRIEEAEAYMEERRQMFWQQGYPIRVLNQAYFAFHGAYADVPGGAAGEDPVGEAVRALWSRVNSPVSFLRKMAWMNDFSDLESEVASATTR